ncbi:MAG: PdxA family dehydrogenase [Brevinema sp.]
MNKKILITLGDPNGIGPEIVKNALSFYPKECQQYFEIIGLEESWKNALPDIYLHPISSCYKPQLGILSPEAGNISLQTLNKAIELLKTNQYAGLVTAPISKEAIVLSGVNGFSGHTEYLAEAFNTHVRMIFWSEKWSVLLMTIHVPLKDVPSLITKDLLRSSIKDALIFQKTFYQKGSIAISGLNPHASENGLFGTEEDVIFNPIINEFTDEDIVGPIPPDTVFYQAEQGRYNMIVSPYHDQALIAFKLLHFHDGVNVSMGLPFWRTSPDHGTAFDIAGKNIASPKAMIEAIKFILQTLN